MATVNFFVGAQKRKIAPIYLRLCAGRGNDLIVKSKLFVDPSRWSNKTQMIKQRITTEDDEILKKRLKELRDFTESKVKNHSGNFTKDWIIDVIDQYHNKKTRNVKTLNEYIDHFISDVKAGVRKNKSNVEYASGTFRGLKEFQRILKEYQGKYSEKRLTKIEEKNNKSSETNGKIYKLRPRKIIDFDDITIDFYNQFIGYLSDEGYSLNTQGRFIKNLKMIMKKAYLDKKHNNIEFEHEAFKVTIVESFSIALTSEELNNIYKYDLSQPDNKRLELARDAFIIMAETAVRISDCKNINVRNIDGINFIEYTQQKTGKKVIIPTTPRFEEIWNKYEKKLPYIHEVYINKYIKTIASLCGINKIEKWTIKKYGKSFETSKKRYELISCHTGRRSAATNWRRAGIPIEDISILLGHGSIKQTKIYLKISEEEDAKRIAQLPSWNQLCIVK